ncbi:ATP-binding protein [Caldisalinibacter kiritimatiensis]|uniref:Serine-protein kinase rsbW n=1 Tax=Caldisalinibacter kiritimatiensis TaxID=1304284 RepID=R1AS19_9FIRM|nr:ATP-binding protein [Caldisalinibacter kiritimatiensis]EOC99441.1 Serine-protein kinase rsbW [Caldisalinibacter kiritimatiensis]
MKLEDREDLIKLSIPNKPEYVSVVRLTASAIASRIGFNIEEIEDIKVAVAEVCTNIIRNGLKNDNMNFDIEFNIYTDKLCITVTNTGEKICEDVTRNENLNSIEEQEEAKLGLFIIQALMDEVECLENGTNFEIKMTKKIGVGN